MKIARLGVAPLNALLAPLRHWRTTLFGGAVAQWRKVFERGAPRSGALPFPCATFAPLEFKDDIRARLFDRWRVIFSEVPPS